jgi:hypothetical protein
MNGNENNNKLVQSYLVHKYGVFIDETEALISHLLLNGQQTEIQKEQISTAYANIALAQYGITNLLSLIIIFFFE